MSNPVPIPEILVFVSDLIFYSKIEQVAQSTGYRLRWIERASQIDQELMDEPLSHMAEPRLEQSAVLLDLLTKKKPALIIFDLGNNDIPWRTWLPLIKTDPATRRLPVICFGSHVDTDTMQMAKSCGADAVLARSHFSRTLPQLIKQYARVPDNSAITSACEQVLSDTARSGLEQFNRGEYFEAHETLEAAWNEDQTAGRELYRAILQVAVAYLQIQRGNYRGAVKMFMRVRQWIDPLPDHCRGVNVAELRADAERVYTELTALGAGNVHHFDSKLFKPVLYTA